MSLYFPRLIRFGVIRLLISVQNPSLDLLVTEAVHNANDTGIFPQVQNAIGSAGGAGLFPPSK